MASLLATLVALVAAISFLVFVIFFGRAPAFRRTPVAWLYRLLCVHIPAGIVRLDRLATGGRCGGCLYAFGHFMSNEKHPTVVVFFLVLLVGSEYLFLPRAWRQLGAASRAAVTVAVALPYAFLYLCVRSDPGVVTVANHDEALSQYPYDYTLFYPGTVCRTCLLAKPARSKHCSVCRRCVARMDHHCVFINNCVGRGNQHWFVLLLASTAALTAYGGVLGARLLAARIRVVFPDVPASRDIFWPLWPLWPLMDIRGEGSPWRAHLTLWVWSLQDDTPLGISTLFSALCSPLVWGLLAYQLYLISAGLTTNESLKWDDVKDDVADGCVFARPLPSPRHQAVVDQPRRSDAGLSAASAPSHGADMVAGRGWPRIPDRVVCCVREPHMAPPTGDGVIGVGDWQRVRSIKELQNLYNLGWWDNFRDVFVNVTSFSSTSGPSSTFARRRVGPKIT